MGGGGAGGRDRMIRTEAMVPAVLEVVTLLVGKRSCGQHGRESRGQKEGRAAGLGQTEPGRNSHSLIPQAEVAETGGRESQ